MIHMHNPTISEQIVALHLEWYEYQRDGFEDLANEVLERIQRLSDLAGMQARQRNETVQEMGVS